MSLTLIVAFLRQRLASPARVALMFLVFSFPLAMLAATHGGLGFQPLGTATMFTFVLGAGMIGGDVSSGAFQLLFARPVSRTGYVLSRWLAVGLGATLLHLAQMLLATLILISNDAFEGWGAMGRHVAEQGLEAFALAAVIAAFSSLLPGIGDAIALFASALMLTMVRAAATFGRQEWLANAIGELERTLSPDVSFATLSGGGPAAWLPLVTVISTMVLGLALASIILGRREISYASDGP